MLQKIKKKRNKLSARDYALYLLSMRLLSSGSLAQKMAQKGYSQEETSEVIQRLTDLQLLNDEQFAQIYFDNLVKYKLFGYFGIKKKLIERKISAALTEKLLRQFSVRDELAIARKVLARQKRGSGKEKESDKQRLVRALASKGFRSETIFKALGVDPEA